MSHFNEHALEMAVIELLKEHGYPPVPQDEVFKEIFEQAENFKKYEQTDEDDVGRSFSAVTLYSRFDEESMSIAAEDMAEYKKKKS